MQKFGLPPGAAVALLLWAEGRYPPCHADAADQSLPDNVHQWLRSGTGFRHKSLLRWFFDNVEFGQALQTLEVCVRGT